jgi:predicted RNase H-like HicB family nuclease
MGLVEMTMMRKFSVIIERDAEGYRGLVPGIRGCHTQAKCLDELMARVREAVELCLGVQATRIQEMITSAGDSLGEQSNL